jgi:hypothetical protein
MKTLTDFKTLVEEEKSDYSKFDMLVRAGLANKAQLSRIHKILDKMQEDRPVFNNADRMILQNLFNKMVDLLSNNKQIFQQTKRVVREDLEEGVIDTSDYKLSKSGKKVKAHRVQLSKKEKDEEQIEESLEPVRGEPPFTLLLKRKTIRQFSDNTYIALYYSEKLKKHFTIPFSKERDIDSSIQAEETQIDEAVMDQLHKIVAGKQAQSVKFATGETRKVDHFTASAITQVHKSLNDENRKKFADMVHKSPAHLTKAADFAFKHTK